MKTLIPPPSESLDADITEDSRDPSQVQVTVNPIQNEETQEENPPNAAPGEESSPTQGQFCESLEDPSLEQRVARARRGSLSPEDMEAVVRALQEIPQENLPLEESTKEIITQRIVKVFCALFSLSFGTAAAGFTTQFLSEITNISSDILRNTMMYTAASTVGMSTFLRLWRQVKEDAPKGIKLLLFFRKCGETENTSQNNEMEISPLTCNEILATTICFLTGTTYGGLLSLGVKHIVDFTNPTFNLIMDSLIISSTIIADGGLFEYSWLYGLESGELLDFQSRSTNGCYTLSDIMSSGTSVLGAVSLSSLGAIGVINLLISLGLSDSVSLFLGGTIATIGFLGEAPFAIKKGRLAVSKAAEVIQNSRNTREQVQNTETQQSGHKLATCLAISSILIYVTQSFAAIYVDIGINLPLPLILTCAMATAYNSLVSCLEAPKQEALEEYNNLKTPTSCQSPLSPRSPSLSLKSSPLFEMGVLNIGVEPSSNALFDEQLRQRILELRNSNTYHDTLSQNLNPDNVLHWTWGEHNAAETEELLHMMQNIMSNNAENQDSGMILYIMGHGHTIPLVIHNSQAYLIEGLENNSELAQNVLTTLNAHLATLGLNEVHFINTAFQTHEYPDMCNDIALHSSLSLLELIRAHPSKSPEELRTLIREHLARMVVKPEP